jgi:hypothetical protein
MSLRVIKFWTKYTPKPDGTVVADDWVEYCAIGQANMATTTSSVRALSRVRPVVDQSEDVAAKIASARWDAVRPLYEAWKHGHEAPVNGTPLAAWPGLAPEQAELIRAAGYRSVEEIAEASDATINQVKLPGIREIQANAKRFVGSRDQAKVAAQLAEKDQQITTLKDQIDELTTMFASLKDDIEHAKPKRGRPPKVVADDDEEHAA